MSYSPRTLAAFSAAIGRIYLDRDAPAGSASASERIPPAVVSPGEDISYLDELLDSHRQTAAQLSAPSVPDDSRQAAFARLRGLGLTPRECEVTAGLVRGRHDAEIAAELGCATKTVSKHVENILAKLGVETRHAAASLTERWLGEHPQGR